MEFVLRDEFIRLGQLLKAAGLVDSGAEAKEVIAGGEVSLNGQVVFQRGKKCFPGDEAVYKDQMIIVKRGEKS